MKTDNEIIIAGLPSSQPTRTVLWFCMLTGIPMKFVSGADEDLTDSPGIKEIQDHFGPKAMQMLSPLGKIPFVMIDDFFMSESLAIVTYLCDLHNYEGYYPQALEIRAKLNQYLFMHDTLIRQATGTVRPFMRGAWGAGAPPEALAEARREGKAIAHKLARVIEGCFLKDDHAYLMGMDHVTVADIACYQEIRQLDWAGITDYQDFGRLRDWFAQMQKLPYHDIAHSFNITLGDICNDPITMKRYVEANLACQQAMHNAGFNVTTLKSFESALQL